MLYVNYMHVEKCCTESLVYLFIYVIFINIYIYITNDEEIQHISNYLGLKKDENVLCEHACCFGTVVTLLKTTCVNIKLFRLRRKCTFVDQGKPMIVIVKYIYLLATTWHILNSVYHINVTQYILYIHI